MAHPVILANMCGHVGRKTRDHKSVTRVMTEEIQSNYLFLKLNI